MTTLHIRHAASHLAVAICLFATISGCQTHKAQNQAQGESGSARGHGLTTATLTDASFNNMPATRVSVPAGWKVQGEMVQGTCLGNFFPAWDAVSPDGQSQFHVLPQFAWQWSRGGHGGNGCIPLTGILTAADFLQKFAAQVPGMRLLSPMPVDDKYRSREETLTNQLNSQFQSQHPNAPPSSRVHETGDVAAFRAMDAQGHEVRLRDTVQCMEGPLASRCFATVDILSAPKGRLNALATFVDGHDLVMDQPIPQYMTLATKRMVQGMQQQAEAGSQVLRHQYLDSTAGLNASAEAFRQQQQRSTDSSMRNANDRMNARSTAASDWRDYAADQQTVTGANGTYKTSSQYSNVWSSPNGPALSNGRTYGSKDNTADPNTATDNTWTQDTKVHGDGQPR